MMSSHKAGEGEKGWSFRTGKMHEEKKGGELRKRGVSLLNKLEKGGGSWAFIPMREFK